MQKFNSKFKSDFSKSFIVENLEGTKKFAQEFIDDLDQNDNIILLKGNLGAGKTSFSQAVLGYVGAEGPFTSPTFVIMKDYKVDFENRREARFKKIYHLDCYRIDESGLDDLGWQDVISDKKNLVLVEWPEKISKSLPKKYIQINFDVLNQDKRKININRNNEN